MSIIDIIITFFVIIGIVGAGWIVIALFVLLYGWIETKIVRSRIAETIKKEVEDGRLKREATKEEYRRRYAGTGNTEVERAFDSVRAGAGSPEPEVIQQMADGNDRSSADRNPEPERRAEPVRRKSGWRRI
jgi:biopolymer transport protein ExbB/TolQ